MLPSNLNQKIEEKERLLSLWGYSAGAAHNDKHVTFSQHRRSSTSQTVTKTIWNATIRIRISSVLNHK